MTVNNDIINEVSDVDIILDKEKLRVVVEVDGNEMRILCEGYCDMDKVTFRIDKIFILINETQWRSTYVRHWRRKARSMNQRIDVRKK